MSLDHNPNETHVVVGMSQVCERLGIDLHEVNFAHEYWENVFEHFLEEYESGRTPLQAESLGANYIATGHYVAKGFIGDSSTNEALLLRGSDRNKDQSYFLYTLQQHQLRKSLFPLGEIEKPVVRAIADDQGFITHNKKDSTGICFIGERRFKDFLSTYLKPNPGDMVNVNGETVGQHDVANNELLVVQGHDHPAMLSNHVTANSMDWVSEDPPKAGDILTAKTRYRQQDHQCEILEIDDQNLTVRFTQPQRAVTPGQALVFYGEFNPRKRLKPTTHELK